MFREFEGYNDFSIDDEWKLIWRMEAPERCRSFLWLLKHERLLTNLSKSRKGLGDAGCKLCGAVCEDILHALRDCYKINHIWKSLVPSNIYEQFFAVELKEWITINIKYCGIQNKEWKIVWAIACHALWEWRNKETHIEGFERPYEPIMHILRRKREYAKAQQSYRYLEGDRRNGAASRWQPPTMNMVKINTDGARKNNGMAGCGGLVRDHTGSWKIGFSKYLGECSSLLAEFWGVFEGLKLTKMLGMRRVEVNVDSTTVTKAIEDGMIRQLDCVTILRNIKALIEEHEVVIISHSYRDANRSADMLANHGCLNKVSTIFDQPPYFLSHYLEDDALGIFGSIEPSL